MISSSTANHGGDSVNLRRPMRFARPLKFVLLGVAVLLVTGLGYGAYMLSQLAPIGAAYAAKVLCSSVFVSGRAVEDVVREDLMADNHPLLHLIQPAADTTRGIATATFLGMTEREATYRPGLGCTIVVGTMPARLAVAVDTGITSAPPSAAGHADGLPVGAPAKNVDPAKLQAAIDWAFAEPDPARLRRSRAVIVVQGGRVIAERYAPGFSADTPMLGWSMTKTVTGVLVGTLVQTGKFSLEQKSAGAGVARSRRSARRHHAGPAAAHDQRTTIHRELRRSAGGRGADAVRARQRRGLRHRQAARGPTRNAVAIFQRHHEHSVPDHP